MRTIANSRAYQTGVATNEWNAADGDNFSHFIPRRMTAEQLMDGVASATGVRPDFPETPPETHAEQLTDPHIGREGFLDVFGRPQRISACECERVSEANLAQALHLLNSQEVQDKLSRGNGRADVLAKDTRPDAEKIEELFMWVFSRRPSAEHLQIAMSHVERHATNKKLAYENLLWALINTKEFLFNH